jgi:hypothetical protein
MQPFPADSGFRLLPGHFPREQQEGLMQDVLAGLEAAPLYQPSMPRTGTPMSVQMSNFGPLGWIADRKGYRYEPCHPVTGAPWPAMPQALLDLWDAVSGWPQPPQACLINIYGWAGRTARAPPVRWYCHRVMLLCWVVPRGASITVSTRSIRAPARFCPRPLLRDGST